MDRLKILLVMMFCVTIAASNPTNSIQREEYTPKKLFRFAQQIFWDSRTNVAIFADTSALAGDPSIYKFDWEKKVLHGANVVHSDITAASFCVATASDPNLLVCGFAQCISFVSLPKFSTKATRGEDILCLTKSDIGDIDRGGTIYNGTLFMSLRPGNYCVQNAPKPKAALIRLDLKCKSFVNAVTPGFYSNGISYSSTTNTLFVAHDCLPAVVAYQYNPSDMSFTFLKVVFKFPQSTASSNFPSGFALDKCGNLYVGDYGSGNVYYINTKNGKLLKTITVPGSHVTAVAIVGPKLDSLCVTTGVGYHDAYGNNRSNSTNPGDGKMYLVPIVNPKCKGNAGVPMAGV